MKNTLAGVLAAIFCLQAAWCEAATYSYDDLDRLAAGESIQTDSLTYFYDEVGNLGQMTTVVVDNDGDGLLNSLEASICTDENDSDSDDDGVSDGDEDANLNGVVDSGETDPCLADSDGDSIQDGTELGYTLESVTPDTDLAVFIPDADPLSTTDPLNTDSDGDGLLDGEEDSNYNGMVDPGETDPAPPRFNGMGWLYLLLQDEDSSAASENTQDIPQEVYPE